MCCVPKHLRSFEARGRGEAKKLTGGAGAWGPGNTDLEVMKSDLNDNLDGIVAPADCPFNPSRQRDELLAASPGRGTERGEKNKRGERGAQGARAANDGSTGTEIHMPLCLISSNMPAI